MYDQTETVAACFDPNISEQQPPPAAANITGFSSHDTKTTITLLQHQQQQESDSCSMDFQNPNLSNHYPHHDPNTWDPTKVSLTHVSEMSFTHFVENFQQQHQQQPPADFLTLLHLPRCTFPSSSSPPPPSASAFGFLGEFNPAMMLDYPLPGSGSCDPTLFHQATHQSSPPLRDLMFHQSLITEYTTERGNGNGIDGFSQEGDTQFYENGLFEMSAGKGNGKGKGKGKGNVNKCPKNSVTEKQRRKNFHDKYDYLSKLIPNQTKNDRASIVLDAINHINELRRTVGELKILVDKKRMAKERMMKRHKAHDKDMDIPDSTSAGDHHSDGLVVVKPEPAEDFNGSTAYQLRSSWIQRKWKDTEVDVRIVDDDVTIKLVQRKKINCLLSVSRTLDELLLDLCHVAGGQVGDYCSYLFSSKICEGSSVYASAIANKLIEVVEKDHAATTSVAPTNSF